MWYRASVRSVVGGHLFQEMAPKQVEALLKLWVGWDHKETVLFSGTAEEERKREREREQV
jgi:hypothetical protein